MFRVDFPPLLRTASVAGSEAAWPMAMLRARALAADDARARAVLDGFEAELALALGLPELQWPARLRPAAVTASPLVAPALDPSQILMLGAVLDPLPRREQAVSITLLAAAFGPRDESPTAAELRARVCSLAIPPGPRDRWRAGFGLMPPDAAVPGAHQGAIRMLTAAVPDGGRVVPVDVTACEPMPVAAALDILFSSLAVRAALRRVGAFASTEHTVVESRAA